MKILLNSTKTMDMTSELPPMPVCSELLFQKKAATLAKELKKFDSSELASLMGLSDKLTASTIKTLKNWGRKNQPRRAALFAFTGIVYQYLDAKSLSKSQIKTAQKNLWILSGLYGALRPMDLIENYRLEMGYKFTLKDYKNLSAFWQESIEDAIDNSLKKNEKLINLAAQEYAKVLSPAKFKDRLITPTFKEIKSDGSLKNAPVHAKIARGAMARFSIEAGCLNPVELMEFNSLNWKASSKPPESGSWLFTRPATS